MKISRHLKLIGLAALGASIPLALYAVDGGNLTITYWGTFGYTNVIPAYYRSVAIGTGNTINVSNALAVGDYLQANNESSLVVGSYNELTSNARFLVGYGTSGSNRRNALEVLNSGDVKIPLKNTASKLTIGTAGTTTPATTTTVILGTADIQRVPPKGGISMGGFEAQ